MSEDEKTGNVTPLSKLETVYYENLKWEIKTGMEGKRAVLYHKDSPIYSTAMKQDISVEEKRSIIKKVYKEILEINRIDFPEFKLIGGQAQPDKVLKQFANIILNLEIIMQEPIRFKKTGTETSHGKSVTKFKKIE